MYSTIRNLMGKMQRENNKDEAWARGEWIHSITIDPAPYPEDGMRAQVHVQFPRVLRMLTVSKKVPFKLEYSGGESFEPTDPIFMKVYDAVATPRVVWLCLLYRKDMLEALSRLTERAESEERFEEDFLTAEEIVRWAAPVTRGNVPHLELLNNIQLFQACVHFQAWGGGVHDGLL